MDTAFSRLCICVSVRVTHGCEMKHGFVPYCSESACISMCACLCEPLCVPVCVHDCPVFL